MHGCLVPPWIVGDGLFRASYDIATALSKRELMWFFFSFFGELSDKRAELALRKIKKKRRKENVFCVVTWILQRNLLKFVRIFIMAKDKNPVIFLRGVDR